MLPDKVEVARRCREGVTVREAELWLADEFERAAKLLRITEPSTFSDMIAAMEGMKRVMDTIRAATYQCV